MQEQLGKFVDTLQRGDKISLVLMGIIVDGTFEEVMDGCVILSDATSPSIKKKHYHLSIPTESIYAWGQREKKGKGQEKEK
jgi:hypothetical protein